MGNSLGGYLATRAAAYEPRIKRLVMYDLIYDFCEALKARMDKKAGKLLDYLTEHPGKLLWKPAEKKMNRVFFLKWLFEQGYSILVLAGESDIYTVFLEEQLKALTNARSVESRVFTKTEHADHHCQIGNMQLVLDVITDWIERKQ